MTIDEQPNVSAGGEDYTSSEGLRALLCRLHAAGPGAWQDDQTAADLMAYAADKYAALARKHQLDPWEAATAAFEAMQYRSTRKAADPWAMVTHAVRVTCIFEERGQGMLCSTQQARRRHFSVFHDAERFSDREIPLSEWHPVFHVTDEPDLDEDAGGDAAAAGRKGMSATAAVEETIALFTEWGWPAATARTAIEHVCGVLARAGSRQTAYESLRRDQHARALLDLPTKSWSALLRILLGHPHPAYAATDTGRGVLLRLLISQSQQMLLDDHDLRLAVEAAAPERGGR
ncbi:hypothetical protein [Aeromicrobium piscarium]|uniref:Serine/arginine repetitive matrix protein 2 n=1 Tax=Aeromicrobium piscarium TaxID=2590901 RepID=A0A554S7W0_9ACTN|nr:hypothetical protein [Aeromicrobium piscarium]TSD62434.1 hypothetical protein FNM00_12475 [Aeromicrobium piscarium]